MIVPVVRCCNNYGVDIFSFQQLAVVAGAINIFSPKFTGAVEMTVVQITYSGGKSEEVLLNPGMVKIWTFPDKALLKLGNAGGVKLSLNGRDIGTPGSKGQVMTIALPENRQVLKESGAADQQ